MLHSPLVSIIIPSFRAPEFLRLALPEFLKCRDCEVIVGLDGDSLAYRRFLEHLPVTLSVTRNRQGACTATNLAVVQARGEYLLLCNDDMLPAPGWLEAMLSEAGPNTVVSAACWEPGLIAVPPCHRQVDFGHEPTSFRRSDFFAAAKEGAAVKTEPGINYPFLISRELWQKAGGLDERFNPGSASDPDFFIRLALSESTPKMIRAHQAIFYHFTSRSSIYVGGRLSLSWKLHRRHGRLMFRQKWGWMWQHRFGEVPSIAGWRGLQPRPEPKLTGRLWRRIWFGPMGGHDVIDCRERRHPAPAVGGDRPRPIGRITIFIWGGLGNMVMALPMVNAARAALGDGNVAIVIPRRELAQLVADPERLGGILSMDRMEFAGALPDLVRNGPAAALTSLPYPKWRYGMLAALSGAGMRVGDRRLPNPLLNRLVDTGVMGSHLVERNMAMLEVLGIGMSQPAFDISVSDGQRIQAGEFLANTGLSRKSAIIGFHPGSGNPMRRWPVENFIELGKRLAGEGWNVIVFGGPGEKGLASQVSHGIGPGAAAYTGPLGTALAVMERCSAFAAADSGLAHCAAGLGLPVLALMGPSDERTYRPYGMKVKVITGQAGCRPCYRPGRPIRCVQEHRLCLDIGVEKALSALQELL